jgi:hypothetical protein
MRTLLPSHFSNGRAAPAATPPQRRADGLRPLPRARPGSRLAWFKRAGGRWTLAFLLWFHGGLGAAESPQTIEYQVKAAFLVKFAMFVEWPARTFPDTRTPITIGILGEDPFGSDFDAALTKETANGRPFKLQRYNTAAELTPCHILFISASERARLAEILQSLRHQPVLLVGDQDHFAHRGGMINFIKDGSRVRFEVNTAAIEAGGLKISSKLLQVARPVTEDAAKEKP